MEIPFTVEQFFDVFGTYNTAIWPVQTLAYILGIVVLVLAFGGSKLAAPIVSRILGFFWIWMGVFYHIVHFSVINPAAWSFGIFFILQGLLFLLFARPAFRFILKPLPVTGGGLHSLCDAYLPPSGYQFRPFLPQSSNVWRCSVPNDDLHFWNIALDDKIGACLPPCHSFALVYCWHECSGEPAGPSRLWARGFRGSRDGFGPDSES